jgi:hypothetical protein
LKKLNIHLVLKIIPPIWPSFLNTSLLLDDSICNNGAQNAESHGYTVIVITVDTDAMLELRDRLSDDLKTVV